MLECKQDFLTKKQKITLASIVQVGDATYHDLAEAEVLCLDTSILRILKAGYIQN